jgi:hypothetical protein
MTDIAEGRTVHARIKYVHDKEIHVSTVESPNDGLFVDAREYIPSKNLYGRGLTFPLDLLDDVMTGLESVRRESSESDEGGSSGRAGR